MTPQAHADTIELKCRRLSSMLDEVQSAACCILSYYLTILLSAVCCLLPAACCLLRTIFLIYCLLSPVCRLPSAFYLNVLLYAVCCQLHTVSHILFAAC
jgi:hypothetical protein